jgi:hypothetical protein
MSKSARTLFLTVLVGLLLACNTLTRPLLPQATTQALPVLDGTWSLKMTQTGGYIGIHHELEIASDGTLTVTDPQQDQTSSIVITPEAMNKLKDLVASSKYQLPQGPQGSCSDCFNYDLEISSNTGTFTVQLDDVSLPPSGLEPLINLLRQTMDDALENPG